MYTNWVVDTLKLMRCFGVQLLQYRCVSLQIRQYFDEPAGITLLSNTVSNNLQCGSTTLLKPVKLQAQRVFSCVHCNSGQQLTSSASTLILQRFWTTLFEAE